MLAEGIKYQIFMFIAVLIATLVLKKKKAEYNIGQRIFIMALICEIILLPKSIIESKEGIIITIIGLYVYCIFYGIVYTLLTEGIIEVCNRIKNHFNR